MTLWAMWTSYEEPREEMSHDELLQAVRTNQYNKSIEKADDAKMVVKEVLKSHRLPGDVKEKLKALLTRLEQ